ncbi:MAG: SPFH domain-containing protein [Huintestinicola sp.]
MTGNINSKYDEKVLKAANGLGAMFFFILLYLASIAGVIYGGMMMDTGDASAAEILLFVVSMIWVCIGWFPFMGIKVIKPNEALVLTVFGKYTGTLKSEGIFFVNPFSVAVNPAAAEPIEQITTASSGQTSSRYTAKTSKKLSMKAMTLDNKKQKINDLNGNPIEVSIVVIWRIVNTAKAVFNVDNYAEYISIQADSTLRDVASLYPYDDTDGDEELRSLRSSSKEVAEKLRNELQGRVDDAGIEIVEARITHLAYAPEIAAVMLQRQQAAAVIEARQKIVDGAVGMVEMALERLSANNVCEFDEERKAQMVSNLLVVLCGNKDAQPIVNSGSIY